jgi:cell division protein FtsX
MNGQSLPPAGTGGTTVANLLTATENWIRQPFTQTMDLTQVVALVGLVLASIILWSRVLAHIGE